MIQVIAGFKLKEGANIDDIFLKFRSATVTHAGFIGAQNLRTINDSSIAVLVTTWENLGSWKLWETSNAMREIIKEAAPLLVEEPKITIYQITPTVTWVG